MLPGKAFVDFQNDVTAADIELSAREAFVSVEHLKRYTTLGMAPDQGKTSNVNALAIMAQLTGRTIPQTGTTRFRFPYTPVGFGGLAGRMREALYRPYRRLPTHDRQEAAGAVFEECGGWLRPASYPRPGETPEAARQREALAVRQSVGLFEGSPLGKIEVRGPDAAEFLDRIYANRASTLKVGEIRYGLMLNELGVIIDDGTTARLKSPERWVMSTTTVAGRRDGDQPGQAAGHHRPGHLRLLLPLRSPRCPRGQQRPGRRLLLRLLGLADRIRRPVRAGPRVHAGVGLGAVAVEPGPAALAEA